MNPDAVLIAGPTASGKSAAALALAERIGGTLINTDSMQVYCETRILTARPRDDEMQRAPHCLYGHVSVHERYDVARYAADAQKALADVRKSGHVPIFVGGTGLYFGALTVGLPDMPTVPASVREAARRRRDALGADAFFAEFAERDPATASRLRASDTQRVLRAYEVFEATGTPLSQWQQGASVPLLAGLSPARFILSPPRAVLHARIARRFELMLADGAFEEAGALEDIDPSLPSAKILGLRELNSVRRGELGRDEATRLAVTATRQYAKRQVTWFRHRMADWTWIGADKSANIVSEMVSFVA
ncbi:MAG: tRNA (adenosine(37)-N6)-dimethylallyltransferase MiaA [Rhizomicrobium sp.]|jgi:tRNA dimethylallyltransferase